MSGDFPKLPGASGMQLLEKSIVFAVRHRSPQRNSVRLLQTIRPDNTFKAARQLGKAEKCLRYHIPPQNSEYGCKTGRVKPAM